jgi:malonyl-CoA O-methyltransferase
LPLRDASVDVLFSNLCLQWVEDLPAVFAGFGACSSPMACCWCRPSAPTRCYELRGAFRKADNVPHVSAFASIAQFGDALIAAGFKNPVLDRDEFVFGHADLGELMRELRTLGATNAMIDRRRSLTVARASRGRGRPMNRGRRDGRLPATGK